jgi:NTE family protein
MGHSSGMGCRPVRISPIPLASSGGVIGAIECGASPARKPVAWLRQVVLMDGGVADQTTLDYAVGQGADEVYLLTPGFS